MGSAVSTPDFAALLDEVRTILARPLPFDERCLELCRLLAGRVPHYAWVGFYWVAPDEEQMLILGPYVGEPTEHTRIPFGKGICGQAAVTLDTFVIQDVSQETNYLSCSPSVRSEIVVPIMREGVFLGELDIDSHHLAPFTDADRAFLEEVAALVAQHKP